MPLTRRQFIRSTAASAGLRPLSHAFAQPATTSATTTQAAFDPDDGSFGFACGAAIAGAVARRIAMKGRSVRFTSIPV
jgi:hypothetical protein